MSLVQFTHRPTSTSIFDELFHPSFFPAKNHAISEPAVNVQEGEKGFVIELAVPGKSKNDFDKGAEDLRLATRHLGMIVGKVDVEEILGSIFNDFCIGK